MHSTRARSTTTTPFRTSARSSASFLVAALLLAWAGDAGATGPAPAPAVETPPAGAATPPKEEKPRQFRKNTFGLGPGLVFWPPHRDDVEQKVEVAPGFAFQHRTALPIVGIFGFEFTNDIVFHDWKAMGDAYRWYFKAPENEDEEDLRAIKLGLLWPGMLFIPFGAANYTTGIGFVLWTSQSLPSVYVDVGGNLALWLRLSDPQFRADFGIGAYGGVGFDMFKNVGANFRVNWGTPFVHTLIRQSSGGITTLLFNVNFGH